MVCRKIFIAWSRLSSRTIRYARFLGLKVYFIRDPPPYLRAFFYTLAILLRRQNDIVFVQLAPGPLLMLAAIMKFMRRFFLVADMHSFFLWPSSAKGIIINKPFGFFLRYCDLILVHADIVKHMMPANLRRKTVVALDPPIELNSEGRMPEEEGSLTIVFPASFAEDEPIENIIMAVKTLSSRGYNIKLIVTGRYERRPELLKYSDNKHIIFTGFLPRGKYYEVLRNCDLIAALTKAKHSLMAVALEALSLGKPLILSDQPVFKPIFGENFMYTDNTVDDLIEKISYIYENREILDTLRRDVKKAKLRYVSRFKATVKALSKILRWICEKRSARR